MRIEGRRQRDTLRAGAARRARRTRPDDVRTRTHDTVGTNERESSLAERENAFATLRRAAHRRGFNSIDRLLRDRAREKMRDANGRVETLVENYGTRLNLVGGKICVGAFGKECRSVLRYIKSNALTSDKLL